ncbi:DUF222 domain-containing protein [Nocardioides panacisoli]|uniref:HNH endonuclease signature motif containing protein n=1 Tax=Nocardioides panacisoli TaxID=627624 RepID=A0ABP7ITK4_9ACTN
MAAEVALARRESPHRGQVLLGFAKLAQAEMPHTLARLKDGTLNEWRAMLLLRETACLSAEQRAFVDEELCADPKGLEGLGTRRLLARAKQLAYELDPKAVVDRASNAAKDRTVTLRPAPETMTYLTALLPVAQGVALRAALQQAAVALIATGDPRSRGQLMADLLVARGTGVPMSTGVEPPAVPVAINLTMSHATLFGGHAAALVEEEVVPAEIARLLAAQSLTGDLQTWIRRLYADRHGRLVAMSSKQRLFPQGLAEFLRIREQGICRNPYCGAPVRHADHVQPAEDGGQTSAENGQGLCEACNHAKQAPGWRQHATDEGIETITPTGHRYLSHAPPPPGWRQPYYVQVAPGRYQLVA